MPLDTALNQTLVTDLARIVALPEFQELNSKLTRFTPFRVLRVEQYELRHTNTLAWLLDPAGSHGMRHAFLDRFLSQVLGEAAPREFDVVAVHTELVLRNDGTFAEDDNENETDEDKRSTQDRLDILVEGRRTDGSHWAVAIEAKINSREGVKQLVRYGNALAQQFQEVEVAKCYLTLDASETISSPEWQRIRWGAEVVTALRDALAASPGIDQRVRQFLLDYEELIGELSGHRNAGTTEVTELANRKDVAPTLRLLNERIKAKRVVHIGDGDWAGVYRQHKATFDICRNAVRKEGAALVWNLINDMLAGWNGWEQIEADNKAMRVRFVPRNWNECQGIDIKATDGSWNLFYFAEFRNHKKKKDIEIKLHVDTPGDPDMQRALMKQIFGEELALRPEYALQPNRGNLAKFVQGEENSLKLYTQSIDWEEQADGTYLLTESFERTLDKFKRAVELHTKALRKLAGLERH